MIITKTKTAPPTVPPTIAGIGRVGSSVSVNGIQSFIMTFKMYFTCHVLPVGVGDDVGLEIGVVAIIRNRNFSLHTV